MDAEQRAAKAEAQLETLQAKYDGLKTEHTALLATNEQLQAQVDGLPELQKRVAELEPFQKQAADLAAKARSLEAARAYDRIAGELKVKPEFKDDVWKLAGFEPKGDEVDEKALRDHMTQFLAEKKHYTESGGKEPEKLPRGEGSSRGGRSPGFGGGDAKERVTREQLNDGEWMAAHEDLISDPSKYEIVQA